MFAALAVPVLVHFSPSPRAVAEPVSIRTKDARPPQCEIPPISGLHLLEGAENPPLILAALSSVTFLVDGAPVDPSLDPPQRISVGSHRLEIRPPDQAPVRTQFRVQPYRPGLFAAQLHPRLGLLLWRLGTACESCSAPLGGETLDPTSGIKPSPDPLVAAAEALRADDWFSAGEILRAVSLARRDEPFYQLAASFYAQANRSDLARQILKRLGSGAGSALSRLLVRLEALEAEEQARRPQVLLARWNSMTERFKTLSARFDSEAQRASGAAATRLEQASESFALAAKTNDLPAMELQVRAGEAILLSLVKDIRAARPNDCEFQAKVVASALE